MERNLNYVHLVNEENIETNEMNSSSPMDNLELVPLDLDCPTITNYACITDMEIECFPIGDGLFLIVPKIHIVQEKRNNVDLFTQGEEINMQGTPILSQQSTFNLEEENHIEEEHVDFEKHT